MKTLLPLFLLSIVSSCAPRIFYSGETFPPYQAQTVDVFYDEDQIGQSYQVIGTLANRGTAVNQKKVKRAIIEKAQAVGADAIVFHDLDMTGESAQLVVLKAKAVRYGSPQ